MLVTLPERVSARNSNALRDGKDEHAQRPVPIVKSIQLARDAESDDALRDVGSLQGNFWDCAARGVEAAILVLRQQIIVLRRGRPRRVPFLVADRMVLGWVCQLFPKACDALAIVRPETVVRWHRAGFRLFWRWKSRAFLLMKRQGSANIPPSWIDRAHAS